MKHQLICWPAAACLLLAGPSGLAQAAEMPARKSGLWEMDNRIEGMPTHGPMQICIDQNADNMVEQRGRPGDKTKPDCSVIDVKRTSDGRTHIHTVCKVDARTTATTDAVVSGDFGKSYRSEMTVRYAPPLEGMSEMRMVSQGRWLGACKPDQKHGDVVMPGMPGMVPGSKGMQDMMNDPRLRELMQRHGQPGQGD